MLISTKASLYRAPGNGSAQPERIMSDLDIRRVQQGKDRDVVALGDGTILVLSGSDHISLRSGITDRIDSVLILKAGPLDLLIGCTPPNLYRIVKGQEARLVPAFQKLPVRDKWYTPWGGPPAVRSMDLTEDGWVYADIHVGSIMRSPDLGVTWEPVVPGLHKDVHQVITSPKDNDRVYANTYLSVYASYDRGETWHHRTDKLNQRYGRGIAVHPDDPDTLLCGVSDGPTGSNVHGQLYRTDDAGETWTHVMEGFPESTRRNIDTFHIQFSGDHAWASDEERLYHSDDKGMTWTLYWTVPEDITVLSTTG